MIGSSNISKAREVIDRLFGIAVDREASDLHLVVGKPPILRLAGELVSIEGAAILSPENVKQLCFSILSNQERERFINKKELDIAHQIVSGKRFRINLHWEKGNVAMAARTIPSEIPSMEDLDLPAVVHGMVDYPHGLVLVTGPTGAGKSTTLAAMIDRILSTKAANVITLEDPIEFLFSSKVGVVRQRQLGQDFVSFQEGLKHILRQDPDVVMVGEMRDMETNSTTLTIAETGHLVFATLHTYSAAQTIDRIIDAFPAYQQNQIRTQLALTLRGIISQQLLPKIDGGRVAAREILVNNYAVANLIRDSKIQQINNVLQTSADEGMNTLVQDLNNLLEMNLISQKIAKEHIIGSTKLGDVIEHEKKSGHG
ncbi:PilT/PilU family type 4a pilus ATPase [Patescibacteria group bacterium]|nr:PilT/PilU family type 4a pilus ATPase [Patescibacteria group bacterium]